MAGICSAPAGAVVLSRGGKVLFGNGSAIADHRCVFQQIGQFPDVAGVVVIQQGPHGLLVDGSYIQPFFLGITLEEVLTQKRDVLLAVPEGRQGNLYNVQPVV